MLRSGAGTGDVRCVQLTAFVEVRIRPELPTATYCPLPHATSYAAALVPRKPCVQLSASGEVMTKPLVPVTRKIPLIQLIFRRLRLVWMNTRLQSTPLLESRMVLDVPTATKRPAPNATPFKGRFVGEAC